MLPFRLPFPPLLALYVQLCCGWWYQLMLIVMLSLSPLDASSGWLLDRPPLASPASHCCYLSLSHGIRSSGKARWAMGRLGWGVLLAPEFLTLPPPHAPSLLCSLPLWVLLLTLSLTHTLTLSLSQTQPASPLCSTPCKLSWPVLLLLAWTLPHCVCVLCKIGKHSQENYMINARD